MWWKVQKLSSSFIINQKFSIILAKDHEIIKTASNYHISSICWLQILLNILQRHNFLNKPQVLPLIQFSQIFMLTLKKSRSPIKVLFLSSFSNHYKPFRCPSFQLNLHNSPFISCFLPFILCLDAFNHFSLSIFINKFNRIIKVESSQHSYLGCA